MRQGTVQDDALLISAITPSAALVEAACLQLAREQPGRSARRVFTWTQLFVLSALAGLLIWCGVRWPRETGVTLYAFAYCVFIIAITWRLFAAARLKPLKRSYYDPKGGEWPFYTVLCPLYKEANIASDLALALSRLDYPRHALEILFLVEEDDLPTISAALAAANAPHMRVVIVPVQRPRTKPKALNVGLALARGSFITVYDAEDRPHPKQLLAALAAFAENDESLVCVQAPLAPDNANERWIAMQFAAEYAIQFREILPLLARLGWPIPLGGTSNHFRTEALRALGGWDPFNVTEDADLGYRIACAGKRCDMIAPPTWEEAPVSFHAWLEQRTRWIKGHMQTWLVMMRDPLARLREMGLMGFFAMQLVLGGGVLASLVHGPLAVIVFAAAVTPFDLLDPAAFSLALIGYAVAAFGALTACAVSGEFSHVRAAITMPLYWPLSSLAAYQALFRLVTRPHHWDKTKHGVARARATPAIKTVQTELPVSGRSSAEPSRLGTQQSA